MNDSYVIYFFNTHGVFVLFLIVILYLWFIEKSKEEALHILLAGGVTALISLAIKEIFGIPRPYVLEGTIAMAGYSVRTASLPSIHAALAFSLSTTVFLHQRRLGLILLTAAILISIGRVTANVHYPIDVVLGALLGVLIALIFEKIHILTHGTRSVRLLKIKNGKPRKN